MFFSTPASLFSRRLQHTSSVYEALKDETGDETARVAPGCSNVFLTADSESSMAENQTAAKSRFCSIHLFFLKAMPGLHTDQAMMAEMVKHHPEITTRMAKVDYTDSILTETHSNIVVNQKFSSSDFAC